MDLLDNYPTADYPLTEEEDRHHGYETIVVGPPSGRADTGAPLGESMLRGSRVIVNNATRHSANHRHNSWNPNAINGVIIQHLNSLPPNSATPRIVEVTGMEEEFEEESGHGIDDPDYPRSDRGAGSRIGEYPTLPAYSGPPLPDRDYHNRGNEESRPDIHRVNLSAGDTGDPPGVTVIPPAPPPPPISQPQPASPLPTQSNVETNLPDNQELHQVIRRALARNFDTTQPTRDPNRDETDRGDNETGEQVASRDSYTQTRQQQSAEVQTTLERHHDTDSGHRQSSNPEDSQRDSREAKGRPRSHRTDGQSEHRSSYHRSGEDNAQMGPRFNSEIPFEDHRRSQSFGQNSGIDNQPRIIEQIIITREIDPETGRPIEEVPLRSMKNRQQNINRPPSAHIVYNQSVRDSARRARGWARFQESQGNWSPREGVDHVDITGIVAGMESDTDFDDYYMPRDTVGLGRGRANQGYDVSPEERRRDRDVPRHTSTRESRQANPTTVPPPPPYTERDISPGHHGSSPSSPLDRQSGYGWGRSVGDRGWHADSDGSSTIAAGWTQRTRVVFAVMLLLSILLLLALVIVVTLYFTAGPGRDCFNGTCESPSVGYIAAFAIIGILALSFMLIGIILCCFACRLSREKRTQRYPVSARR